MATKIHRNDEVIVISGKDKGKKGKVTKVFNAKKVIVEGINYVTKHQKPIPSLEKKGGILKKESFINISNVAIFNKLIGKADRVGFRFEKGKKVRFFKSNKKIISS